MSSFCGGTLRFVPDLFPDVLFDDVPMLFSEDLPKLLMHRAGNTKVRGITVPLTSCLTGLD